MQFTPGQTIVHPHHGPATVQSITVRTVKNIQSRYLVLEIRDSNLTVGVPENKAETIGLRAVFNRTEIEKLIEVLRASTGREESQWSRRMKAAQEKLASGDIFVVAAVVRDLLRRSATGHLSPSEKDMLKHAKQPLVTEVSLSLGLEAADAETLVDALPRLAEGQSADIVLPAGTQWPRELVAV